MAVEDADWQPFDACATCGAPFDHGVTYPVETREGPAGNLELYSFCDAECRTTWDAPG